MVAPIIDAKPDAEETKPKPLTPEELADRLVPNDPRISPDGRHVAFTVQAASKKEEYTESAIWLSRDGAPATRFTAGVGSDNSPRWSPDGTRLAFLSDRKDTKEHDKSMVYLLDLNGGEAKPLGELDGELGDPQWSPDGTKIAVLREDPETAEEKKKKEERDDAVVVETEKKRNRVFVIDVETGKARQLTYGPRQVWSYGWNRDGTQIAITTTEGYDENAACGAGDLWTVPVGGGLPKHIAHFPSLPGSPVFVDGGIVVRANGHWEDPPDSVWFVPEGGEPRNVLPGLKGNVDEIYPIPGDTTRVGARIVEGVHGGAYTVEIATGELTRVTPEGQHGDGSIQGGPTFSTDGKRIAVVWSEGQVPQEVYVADTAGAPSKLTELGKDFVGRLQPVETVTWTSDGWEIQGLLTYPVGYEAGKRYPLLVEIHGGPSWQWEDFCFLDWHDWAQLMASQGFAVLAPNPRGSTGRGVEFQRQLQNDVGGGEVRDVISGAMAMVERGIADEDRLGVGGWSWGGYLTAITITRTNIFKAAVMGAGLSNMVSDHGTDDIPKANLLYFSHEPYEDFEPYWEASAMKHIKNCTTPTLILHGAEDARVQHWQGAEMFRALKTLGVPVEFVRYPREKHPIDERKHQIDLMRRLIDWYTKWLKP